MKKITFLLYPLLLALVSQELQSATQYYPTHRFPTDRSFHLSYNFGIMRTSSNYEVDGATGPLLLDSTINRYRHRITPEYQPNRAFSFGAYLQFDHMNLSSDEDNSASKNSFSDQVIFAEYRFLDVPGASLGISPVIKFPFYQNPTNSDLNNNQSRTAILMGDGQADFTGMLTSELWPTNVFRVRLDFGYTYRTDSYSAELPYMFTAGFVTQKIDFDLRLKGAWSLGNDSIAADDSAAAANAQAMQAAFAGSQYALAENPSQTLFEMALEYWFDPRWGLAASLEKTLRGKNSPNFWAMNFGLTYRFAEREQRVRPRAYEVDISVDQEKGMFEGETQNSSEDSLINESQEE